MTEVFNKQGSHIIVKSHLPVSFCFRKKRLAFFHRTLSFFTGSCPTVPEINTGLTDQGRYKRIRLFSQVCYLFRVRGGSNGRCIAITPAALVDDLYTHRPALVLFLPDKHTYKIAGHLKT